MLHAPIVNKHSNTGHDVDELECSIKEYQSHIEDYRRNSHCHYIVQRTDGDSMMPIRNLEKSDLSGLVRVLNQLKNQKKISEETFNTTIKALLSIHLENLAREQVSIFQRIVLQCLLSGLWQVTYSIRNDTEGNRKPKPYPIRSRRSQAGT